MRTIRLPCLGLLATLACSEPGVTAPDASGPAPIPPEDEDQDGWPAGADCDDANPSVHPAAVEQCNGIDDDCSALSSEAILLDEVESAPDGAEIVLCDGSYWGNVVLTGRSVTVRADGFAALYPILYDVPVFTLDDAELHLEDVAVFGATGDWYRDVPLLELADSTVVIRRSELSGQYGAVRAEAGSSLLIEDTTVTGGWLYTAGGAIQLSESTLEMHGGALIDSYSPAEGAAIHATDSTVHLIDTSVEDNEAATSGGAIYALRTLVTLSGVTMSRNIGGDGGALHLEDSELAAIDTRIVDNFAWNRGGGVFLLASTADLDLVEIGENVAYEVGGGLYAQASTITGEYTLVSANRTVYGGSAGGLELTAESHVDAVGWTIEYNDATSEGGGIRLASASFLGDETTIVRENYAYTGGGVALVQGSAVFEAGLVSSNLAGHGAGILNDTLVSTGTIAAQVRDNVATINGAGIYVATGSLAFDGVLHRNEAPSGGGAWLESGTALTGTIDWGAGLDDNTPDDVATEEGATWSSDTSGTWSCDGTGCD